MKFIVKIFKIIYLLIYQYILSRIEGGNNFNSLSVKIRHLYLSPLFKNLGKNVNIQSHVRVEGWHNISIDDYSGIGRGSHLSAMAEIRIGKNVMIAEQLLIFTTNHGISSSQNMIDLPMIPAAVSIGNNVWIGARVTILPGVIIGDNVVIASGAVVSKSFPSNLIIGGVPAKVIKQIES